MGYEVSNLGKRWRLLLPVHLALVFGAFLVSFDISSNNYGDSPPGYNTGVIIYASSHYRGAKMQVKENSYNKKCK